MEPAPGRILEVSEARRAHEEALGRGVSLAGVVKASTLYWGRHAPLVTLLKRRGDRERPNAAWAARISTDPVFGRLYIGDIFVAHLAPAAPYAFRVDVARGPEDSNGVLGRLASLSRDAAFVGYPYPLARAHQLADLMPISLRRGASPPLDTSNEPVKRPESEGETAKS